MIMIIIFIIITTRSSKVKLTVRRTWRCALYGHSEHLLP